MFRRERGEDEGQGKQERQEFPLLGRLRIQSGVPLKQLNARRVRPSVNSRSELA